jgi:hypothetical protein
MSPLIWTALAITAGLITQWLFARRSDGEAYR